LTDSAALVKDSRISVSNSFDAFLPFLFFAIQQDRCPLAETLGCRRVESHGLDKAGTFCPVILPFDHRSLPRVFEGMIFDVDNHPVAYVLLMKTLAERSAHVFVLRKK
jgi:hypothetical protein